MATYVNDLRLKEISTGDESGTWGTSTNTNLELIGEALGYATQQVFSSDADATTTIADGASDPARAMYFKITSAGSLTATRTCTIAPNTVSRVMFIENATTGSQSIAISQGSGASVTIATGKTAVVYLDGAGSGAAVVDAMSGVDPGVTDTLTEVLVAGNTSGGTNIELSTTDKVQFRDADIYLNSSVDGQLDIVADTEIQIAATTVDLNGNLDVSGTTLVTGVLTTTAATVFNGGFASNADSTLGTDKKVQFRDAAIYLNSSVDGQLDIVADTEIQIAATTVDLNGDLDVSGTALVTGVLTTTAATVHTNGITMPDNAKAIFGAGSDLEIYHDGSDSYVKDNGAGDLIIQAYDDIKFQQSTDNADLVTINTGGNVTIHGGNLDVTGSVTADGLTVDDTSGTVGLFNSTAVASTLAINNTHANAWGSNIAFRTGGTDAGYFGSIGSLLGNTDQDLSVYSTAGNGFRIYTNGNNERLRLDASGNVGIGTSSPQSTYKLTISGTDSVFPSVYLENTTNSKAYSMRATGTSWIIRDNTVGADRLNIDSSGNVGIGVVPPSSQVSYIRNVQIQGLQAYGHTGINDWGGFFTNSYIDAAGVRKYISSSQYAHNLHFDNNGSFIFYNAPNTNSAGDTVPFVERLRVDASGNLLVGTTDTVIWNDTSGEGVVIGPNAIQVARASDVCLLLNRQSTDGVVQAFASRGVQVGDITVSVSSTAYNTSSDQRLKENITDANDAGDKIDAIKVRQYDWKADGSHQDYGMVAQELLEVAPEAVSGDPDSEEMMGVDYSKLVPMMLKEIQSLRARVSELES
jgi:hypothetical protein